MRRYSAIFALFVIIVAPVAAVARANETKSYSYDVLGRLIATQSSGSVNNGQTQSLCYDAAGNRSVYLSNSTGTLAVCGGSGGSTPSSQPPATHPDTVGVMHCGGYAEVNVVSNDTDPGGNYPLTLVSVDHTDVAYLVSSTNVGIIGPDSSGSFVVTYTVKNSLGAQSTGALTVYVSGSGVCN